MFKKRKAGKAPSEAQDLFIEAPVQLAKDDFDRRSLSVDFEADDADNLSIVESMDDSDEFSNFRNFVQENPSYSEPLPQQLSMRSEPMPQLRIKSKTLPKPRQSNIPTSLSNISQADLVVGRKQLKKPTNKLKPISLNRADLFDSFEVTDYFPILYCKTFLQSQIVSGDIVSLNFGGVDQLTDVLFYVLQAVNLRLPNLNFLSCAGCAHLTDVGVEWIMKLFPSLKTVNFNGCCNLTEKSLKHILSSPKPPAEINLQSTNVGVGRKDPDEEGIKLLGCPIVSSFGKGTDMNVRFETFKAVILNDGELTAEIGQQLTNQPPSSSNKEGVAFWEKWKPLNSSFSFQLFEVDYSKTTSDLVLSDGCVVFLPFPNTGDTMETIVESLYRRIMKVACEYPDSVCVILEVNGPEDQSKNSFTLSNVEKNLQQKILDLSTTMKEQIAKMFKWKWIIDAFQFDNQQYFGKWVDKYQTIDGLQFFKASLGSGQVQIVRSSFSKISTGKKDSVPSYGEALKQAVQKILSKQPYYETVSPYLLNLALTLNKTNLQKVETALQEIPESLREMFGQKNSSFSHLSKGLEILNLRAEVMYFKKENGFVVGNIGEFFKGLNSALNMTSTRLTVSCLEPGSPCWTLSDILNHLEGEQSKEQVQDLILLLVEQGCILPLEIEDSTEPVYINFDQLQIEPPKILEMLWPSVIPETDVQADKFYTFIPEIPESFLSTFIRHVNKVYQLRTVWRRGTLIQHGPVDILISRNRNSRGEAVISVSCRTFKIPDSSVQKDCLYSSLATVTRILEYVIKQYQVWAKITVPCPTCVPTKELNLMLQVERCQHFHTVRFTNGVKCKIEGENGRTYNSDEILGTVLSTDSVVARHADWYLEHSKNSCVPRDRCFQCSRVTRDQDGKVNILCPNCGMCTSCVKFMAKVEKCLNPGFSSARGSKGSLISFNLTNSLLPLNYSMGPCLFSELTFILTRGNTINFSLKLLKTGATLNYDLHKGEVKGLTEESEQNNDWKCNEGDRVTIRVQYGKTFAELQIVCLVNQFEIWRKTVERQSIMPHFASGDTFLGFFLQTPGIKSQWQTDTSLDRLIENMYLRKTSWFILGRILSQWQTDTSLDRLVEKMCFEYENDDGSLVSARVTGNNNKTVSFITDHLAPSDLNNAKTDELTSPKLHPAGYAQSCQKPLNGKTLEDSLEVYDYKVKEKGISLAPLWLFNEVQRGTVISLPSGETTVDKMPCLIRPNSASIQSERYQMIPNLETVLYKNGQIDFTGTAMAFLPRTKMASTMECPTRHLAGDLSNLTCHPLCYIRAECEDMLTLHPAKQEKDERNPYWQVHFVGAEGFHMPQDVLSDEEFIPFFWAWHALLASSEEFQLPETYDKLIGQPGSLTKLQMESALMNYLQWQSYSLQFRMGDKIHDSTYWEPDYLMKMAKMMQTLTKKNLESTGLKEFVTVLSQDTIYLCPAHQASQQLYVQLEEFPFSDFMGYNNFITSLKIEGNNISYLPENFFSEFPHLLDLQLSSNGLFELPSGFSFCKDLCNLKLKDNQLQTLPDDLASCKKLKLLELSMNPMDEIPSVVMEIKSLERLYVSNMQIQALPENIGNLTILDVLNASGNCISSLPASFRELKKLTQLYLNGIPWMQNSQNTLLSKEHFEKFLDKYANLLDWLEDHNHDKELLYKMFDEDQNGTLDSQEVAKLNATLFLIFPRFGHKGKEAPDDETYSGFPEEILSLENLEYLSLQYHGLVTLPESISNLKKLSNINLSHNPYLTTVAAAAGNLPLKMLALDDCPSLKTPPKEIRSRGFASTYAYLRRLLSGSVECHRTKLMLVGLGGAGKTSLSRALLSGSFKTETSASEAITDGIDISTWTVKSGEEHISYSVWDFAGQTVYYNTHQFFLSDRAVYLLLWNIRLGHEHAGLDFWLSSISVHAPKAPIFVVGTHLDKVSKTELPMAEMMEKFPQIAGFHFISSHTGQGVLKLQEHLFKVTLEQPYMGEKIPGVWLNFERKILKHQNESSVMKFKDVEQIAGDAGIFDQSEISQAVQFLHDLGALQHFDNEFLRSYVVINPQWIVNVMACVVSVKDSPIQEGRFYHKDVNQVWREYPVELHEWLLRLTEEFDLTFPMTGQQLNLVPCLLPEIQPKIEWRELERDSAERETKMIYRFSYLPAGLFNRGQVRLYQFSDSSVIWKRGSLLRKNGHQALLQQTKESELVIKVQGPRPENILFLIHEVFEGLIAETFHGVTYDFLVPCPDCLKSASRDPHMFSSSTVRRASELKAPFLQCQKYFHTISVIDLLANMPPVNNKDYDIHLVSAVRGLKDLKKDLCADIFISYCPQNNAPKAVGPEKVYSDLESKGYKCWFPKDGREKNVDHLAKALMDCQVFMALVSNEYVLDKNCCDIFKYARLILKKPIILVVVGTGFEWRQSKLGLLLADNVFVNMQKGEQYTTKFEELLNQVQERIHPETKDVGHPPCFISYSWQNSAIAVSKGTRQTEGALGYGDPRSLKGYLEESGVKCWIDVERVGVNGLFEDIAEGLLNAKLMVACVSDEYANSPNCQFEFRFAASTLKLPIVLAITGTGNAWRAKEVGALSIEYPMVSFQEKSETAHKKLLTLVNEQLQNVTEDDSEKRKKKKNDLNEAHKNMSFQELYELAQRKFLRQVAHYAEKQEALYPRLFVADFMKETNDDDSEFTEAEKKDDNSEKPARRPLSSKISKSSIDIQEDDLIEDFHRKKYCFYILCEHEEGWHSCSDPLQASELFGQSKLEKYSPYLSRITTLLRYNRQVYLNCMAGQDGDSYLHWLDQNPQAIESDFQSTYQEFRQEIINADSNSFMGNLSRCHLPNGKTIWLCEEHQKESRVTVLNNVFATMAAGVSETTTENLMLEHLGELDSQVIIRQYGSSGPRKRRSVKRRKTKVGNKVPIRIPKSLPKPSPSDETQTANNEPKEEPKIAILSEPPIEEKMAEETEGRTSSEKGDNSTDGTASTNNQNVDEISKGSEIQIVPSMMVKSDAVTDTTPSSRQSSTISETQATSHENKTVLERKDAVRRNPSTKDPPKQTKSSTCTIT